MKTVVHNKRSKDDVLHIETEGGIINVHVGLHDDKGRDITAIEILPDQYSGESWKFADKPKAKSANIRLTPVVNKRPRGRIKPRLSR
jgi:hypothetical protein